MKSLKGRKEGKDEELNREAIWPFGQRSVRTKCCVSESKQKEKRKIERVRENMRKRVVSEKKMRVSLLKLYLLSVVISI